MKKCNYCGSVREDDLETCCGLSEFTPIVDETIDDKVDDKVEDELFVQPAAHELLVELVDLVELDEIVEDAEYPEWINEIQYEDVKLQAKNRWFDEHPGVVARVKKYLGM